MNSSGVLPISFARFVSQYLAHLRAYIGIGSISIHLPDEIAGGLDKRPEFLFALAQRIFSAYTLGDITVGTPEADSVHPAH